MATNSVNLDNERSSEKHMMIDGRDDEIKEAPIQIISQCQSHGSTNGHYLKIKSNEAIKENLTVTANGSEDDPATYWTAYFTLDDNLEQIVILKNNHFSDQTRGKCVLFTKLDGNKDQYILGVKRITEIPKRLLAIDPSIGFYKEPRAIGSEIISLQSALNKTLFVGFDASGLPIPMNQVDKHSPYLEAYFKIIPY